LTLNASSGTPFSGASVGQWISILSGSEGSGTGLNSSTTFVSQIVSIGGSGASVTVYTDDNPTARTYIGSFSNANSGIFGASGTVTVRVGGAWNFPFVGFITLSSYRLTEYNAVYLIYNIRLNIKNGTYSFSTTNVTLADGARTTGFVLWRGYNNTPGDLDNVANPGTHPMMSWTTTSGGSPLTIPAYHRFENIDFSVSGSLSNPLITISGLGVMMTRCRITSTHGAITISGAGFDAWACYFATTSTTVTNTYCGSNGGLPRFLQCVFQGGLYNVTLGYQGSFIECLMKNPTSHHIYSTAASQGSIAHRCTFYNSGASADAINIASNIQYLTISYPIFSNISRYAINVPDTSFVGLRIVGADYYSITSGQLNGVYESYQHAAITESASPFTSASTNDFTLVSTSTAVTQTFVFEMP
jgi:hypothetical protein